MVLGLWKEAGKEPIAVGMYCNCQVEEQQLGDTERQTSKWEGASRFSPPPAASFPIGRMDPEAPWQWEMQSTEPQVQHYKASREVSLEVRDGRAVITCRALGRT